MLVEPIIKIWLLQKPQLANFYSNVRKSFQIFVKDNKPIGDKWSFDEDNRKRVPKGYQSPKSYTFESKYFEEIKKLIDKFFQNTLEIWKRK